MIQTTDYSIFKYIPGNRKIRSDNLAKIIASIKAKNLLAMRPIDVNENMEILDGQHRLEAAKILNIPIYYKISQGDIDDVWRLNQAQREWGAVDYLNYYVVKGNENYCKLNRLMERLSISLSLAIPLVADNGVSLGRHGGDFYSKVFNAGKFVYSDAIELRAIETMRKIDAFIDFMASRGGYGRGALRQQRLILALRVFFNLENVDLDLFLQKLELRLNLFHKCLSIREYIEIFIAIYNYRNATPTHYEGIR